jgi:hypothetical protein
MLRVLNDLFHYNDVVGTLHWKVQPMKRMKLTCSPSENCIQVAQSKLFNILTKGK